MIRFAFFFLKFSKKIRLKTLLKAEFFFHFFVVKYFLFCFLFVTMTHAGALLDLRHSPTYAKGASMIGQKIKLLFSHLNSPKKILKKLLFHAFFWTYERIQKMETLATVDLQNRFNRSARQREGIILTNNNAERLLRDTGLEGRQSIYQESEFRINTDDVHRVRISDLRRRGTYRRV